MSNEKYEVLDELSGVAFQPTAEAPGGMGSFLSDAGGMFGAGGMSMPPLDIDLSSRAESRAVSGGPFRSGDITFGLKTNTLLIAGAVVLGLYLLFGRK